MSQPDPNLRHDSVNHLQQLLGEGGRKAFDLVPTTLGNVIKKQLWKGRTDQQGHAFQSFEAFVNYKLWWGLESNIDELLVYCRKRKDVESLLRQEVGTAAGHGEIGGGHSRGDIVTSATRGNNPTYALRRLKRDRPDLAEKVIAGTMSANAAAIEAGFREKLTRFEQILKWLPALTPEQCDQVEQRCAALKGAL